MRLPSLWQKKEEAGGIKYKEFQCKYNDDVIMLKLNTSTPDLLSFTILSGKRKNKLKDYEYTFLSKEEIKNKFFPALLDADGSSFFVECECGSEIIRIVYNNEDNKLDEFYFDIFDNFFYIVTKKGVLSSIILTREMAERLLRTLMLYVNTGTI